MRKAAATHNLKIDHGTYKIMPGTSLYVYEESEGLPENRFRNIQERDDFIMTNNLVKHPSEYKEWVFPDGVAAGDVRRYNEVLYQCIQSHITQEDWTPDNTPALWKLYDEGIPEWRAPTGSHDVYPLYFVVTYQGKVYRSLHAANSWVPGSDDRLWELLSEEDEEPPEEIPAWKQPTSVNPYMKGDKVHYKGYVYESLIDNNVWSPEAYPQGWRNLGEYTG